MKVSLKLQIIYKKKKQKKQKQNSLPNQRHAIDSNVNVKVGVRAALAIGHTQWAARDFSFLWADGVLF